MRIEPDTRIVLGFDVEGFTEVFLPEHPDLAARLGLRTEADLALMPYWLAWRVAAEALEPTTA